MKLFVAKLNRDAVESDLLEWFGAMGPVKSVKAVSYTHLTLPTILLV